MALIAVAADKGAPGVTTASVALAAVWPRPVLLAECDPSGGDLVYRLPAADGGRVDPRRGLLSLAVAARRGLQPHQVWEHAQKLHGGLDILTGVSGAEQGAGLELLWGSVGKLLAAVPQADVIADCGRIGVDGPVYDLLAQASSVVLLSRATLGDVIRLRDRVAAVAGALQRRGRSTGRIDVVVVADYKHFSSAITEVGQALRQSGVPARILGGLAHEPKSADQLRGEWSGKLDKSMFIRTARAIAADLMVGLPEPATVGGSSDSAPGPVGQPPAPQDRQAAARRPVPPATETPAGRPATVPQRYPDPHVRGSQPPAASPQQYPLPPEKVPPDKQYALPRDTPPPGRPQATQPYAAPPRPPQSPGTPVQESAPRGRHAGAHAAPGRLGQPPREDDSLPQAVALPPLAEPGPENSSGRTRGR
ncbi:MAG TPA: hypothetical protein VGL63_07290 [Streptosporangiaceae bacterium]|jgi:hypothetical protein